MVIINWNRLVKWQNDSGITADEDLSETMALAMTVGTTKIQILQQKVMSSLSKTKSSETHGECGEETLTDQKTCAV